MMQDISEKYYCAQWLDRFEYSLWEWINKDPLVPIKWGQGTIPASKLMEIKETMELAGGWWTWIDDYGEVFLPLETWIEIYKEETKE